MIKIEHLEDKDLKAVVEIEKLSFSNPKAESIFKEDEHKYLVAKNDNKLLGYIGIEEIDREKHIINMAVHPEERGRGIGKKLMDSVLNERDVFFLEVRVSNQIAQKLYGKYGFKIVGTRKSYYSDNGEDAYIMRKEPK